MHIVVMPPFDKEFFGGSDRLELEARSLFGLVRALDKLAPGFADLAEVRAAFAIDGVLETDWSSSLAEAKEVIVMPRVAGGCDLSDPDRGLSSPSPSGAGLGWGNSFTRHDCLTSPAPRSPPLKGRGG